MAITLYSNKKAYHDYEILDKQEVGIVLQGWEVKSIKGGRMNFSGAFVQVTESNEMILKSATVARWPAAAPMPELVEKRDRVLLIKKQQARRIGSIAKRPGHTLVPLSVYVNDKGLIKLEIGLAKGKRRREKKQKMKERDLQRQLERDLKSHY